MLVYYDVVLYNVAAAEMRFCHSHHLQSARSPIFAVQLGARNPGQQKAGLAASSNFFSLHIIEITILQCFQNSRRITSCV
jgi:hypothetical protein